MRSHEKRFAERIKNVKRASEDLAAVANRLEVSIRNAWGSLDSTTSDQGVRLTQTIIRAAQYVNALVTIEAAEPQALDHPDLGRIIVNGKAVPDDFLEWRHGRRSLRDYAMQYAETMRVRSVQIRDGKLVLRPRSD